MGVAESSGSSQNVTGPTAIRVHDANPLLYTTPQEHMIIQPYWVLIVQLFVKQIIANRVWNRIRHNTWATTQEIAMGRIVLMLQIAYLKAKKSILESVRTARQHQTTTTSKSPTLKQTTINFFKDTFTSPQSLLDRAASAGSNDFSTLRSNIDELDDEIEQKKNEIESSQKKREELSRRLQLDIFDLLVHCLPLLGQTIWYFYLQSKCMSAEQASTWNCYNVFGYRLYNYVFTSYCAFFWLTMMKLPIYVDSERNTNETNDKNLRSGWQKCIDVLRKIEFHASFWSSCITIIVVGVPIAPYLLTNVIPMACTYTFICIIYIVLWLSALLFCRILVTIPLINKLLFGILEDILKEYKHFYAPYLMFLFTILTLPILFTTFFNYSQYVYYSNNLFNTMTYEFDSRNTATYFRGLQSSASNTFHTVLFFI
ncbi:unnamed protein product [Adineta ricciae]|uniref:Uncharacterized protein n=1 Tax=Adineta ricciae TaxID=249248 RepID=A0A814UFS9_ADIRI|nr:unnamed protein product [Adineta ricciae]CAF1173868.1 unnamed protein product [Adineta ricciae]